jgi:tetratricopeptide (TPR) repeat protein
MGQKGETNSSAARSSLSAPPRSPLELAQEMCWDAWELASRKQRIELAKGALELSPDCADAYVILADEERTLKKAVALYAKGVEAGERALGPEFFKREVGHFWGLSGTRPYMRARFGLARCLWRLRRHDEAIAHFSETLRLNPNDNQGVRYMLARYLLEVGRDSDAVDILNFYDGDGTAEWNYTWVLITFRKEGDSESARDLLWKAIRANYHAPNFLLGRRSLPPVLPDEFSVGFESEAVCYADENTTVWRQTAGALEWLGRQLRCDY